MTGLIAKMTIPTVNMLFTFPAIRLVEKWGRKKLLYMGGACMLLTMLAAGVAFTMVGTPSAPSPDAVRKLDSDVNGFITKAEFQAFAKERGISDDEKLADLFQKIDSDRDGSITRPELKGAFDVNWQKANKIQGQMKAFLFGLGDIGAAPKWILLISAVIYIFGFAISWGPVVWLVCSEIFPLEGREVGMTITTMVNWTFAGLLMANALTFMDTYGNASIFYVFAVFCIGSIIFTRLFVPETKGITLEELEYNLKRGKPMRNLGDPVHIE
jgi:MFS family permease